MCGRYYVDDSTFREVEKLIAEINEMSCQKTPQSRQFLAQEKSAGDLHPGDRAPILLCEGDGTLRLQWQKWGMPGIKKGSLIFNARSETAAEKKMFQQGLRCRRVVIPAGWFYEWNRAKEKITFTGKKEPVLYMAGLYNQYEDGPHFVILTTQANASMKPTHDRMPLILERGEISGWLREENQIAPLLKKTPPELDKRAEYEQICFL